MPEIPSGMLKGCGFGGFIFHHKLTDWPISLLNIKSVFIVSSQ
jgi:hypothetical protein